MTWDMTATKEGRPVLYLLLRYHQSCFCLGSELGGLFAGGSEIAGCLPRYLWWLKLGFLCGCFVVWHPLRFS